jgi:hypothetical protein
VNGLPVAAVNEFDALATLTVKFRVADEAAV